MLAAPPTDLPYFVNWGTTGPVVYAVSGSNIVIVVPKGTPQVPVPNKTQASFCLLQSSSKLTDWTTLGYFTNYASGLYVLDVTATNQGKYFYRFVPQ